MTPNVVPPLTWLYVPGHCPDRITKAIASRAHAVIVDLEDGVPLGAKREARAVVGDLLGTLLPKPLFLRVDPRTDDDLELAARLQLAGIVVPKVASAVDIPVTFPVHAMIESARGVEAAFEIASHPAVVGIALGEADLTSELGAQEEGLTWARSRIVNAAVAAGLPRPPQAVYMRLHDPDGLARSCRQGQALGHLGRQAIHPAQLETIERTYLPTADEVESARSALAALEAGVVGTTREGTFLDQAVLGSAKSTLALASAYGTFDSRV